jgi:hypothetical protein
MLAAARSGAGGSDWLLAELCRFIASGIGVRVLAECCQDIRQVGQRLGEVGAVAVWAGGGQLASRPM